LWKLANVEKGCLRASSPEFNVQIRPLRGIQSGYLRTPGCSWLNMTSTNWTSTMVQTGFFEALAHGSMLWISPASINPLGKVHVTFLGIIHGLNEKYASLPQR